MTYAYPVWCTVNSTELEKLERIQRLSLLNVTGCMSTTSLAAMEILAHTPPLRLVLRESAALEFLRLLRKPDDYPIKTITAMLADNPTTNPIAVPADIMRQSVKDTAKRVDLNAVDKEPAYDPLKVGIRSISKKLIAWGDLGSAGTRTAIQQITANRIATDHIATLQNYMIAYTDGSALNNPGPCGAAAAIFINSHDQTPVSLKRPVSKLSTSFHAELVAIELALDYVVSYSTTNEVNKVAVLTDCQSALQTVTSTSNQSSHPRTISRIVQCIQILDKRNIDVEITWIAGHSGLNGNNIADSLAKEAAVEASEMEPELLNITEPSIVKSEIRKDMFTAWQRQWDISPIARSLHEALPIVPRKNSNHRLQDPLI